MRRVLSRLGFVAVSIALACAAASLTSGAQASFAGANGRIFFTSSDGDIYSIAPDGTGLRRLTSEPRAEWAPKASPDGKRIAFSRDTGETCGRVYWAQGDELFVMNADGSGITRLTNNCPNSDYGASWSPSGTRLVFVRNQDIWTMHADGIGAVRLTCTAGDGEPAWSPDGSLIAFTRKFQVFVMRPDGSDVRQLTVGAPVAASPSFTPDGARIAFIRHAGDDIGLFVVGIDGTGARRVDAGYDWAPAWSPDGSKIVFNSNRDHPSTATQALYTIDRDGGALTKIFDSLSAGGADWAPAGAAAALGSEPDVTPDDTACPESPAAPPTPPTPPVVSPPTVVVRAADVVPPNRLRVDRVAFTPLTVRSRRTISLRVRVAEQLGGLPVSGTAVSVESVPPGLVRAPAQQITDASGTTVFRLQPTQRLRLVRGRLVLAVRVRVQDLPWFGGVSGLRLVSVRTAAK
jgi:hypothetical protein